MRTVKVEKNLEKNTAAKKAVEKKEVNAAAPVETAKTEKAATAPKASVAAPKVPVAAPVKKEAAAKPVKPAAKKEAPAKTTKAAKASVSQNIVLQVNGREDLTMESLVDRVKEAYAAEGHSTASIKSVDIYVKPEENMVYYVIDGYASGISLY
ncbi:MAG: DUF6465 family protein [Lachnospiraceae bacterium]|nr:DUF6465 family protein [Lachnospiraceae bacterium]